MSSHEKLLKLVRARGRKAEPFARGIGTADAYVRTVSDAIGWDRAYKHFAWGVDSWNDIVLKASRTLVYGNDDMVKLADSEGPRIETPKNTLMVFSHVLTSSRKDRDGDVLHSDGATVDVKMPLLWQHVHTSPIGKFLAIREQNANRLVVCSAIVDINELCHDAAVMIDNGIGRFSHGFRAVDFTKVKEGVNGSGGFDVTKFEIMEESLVSVPANPDAEVEEVLLGLVEGGKLKSPVMKEVGRGLREKRPARVQGVTLKVVERAGDREVTRELTCGSFDELKAAHEAGLIGKGNEDADERGDEAGSGAAGTPGEADDAGRKGSEGGEAGAAADAEVKALTADEFEAFEECGADGVPLPDEKGQIPADMKPYDNEHAARQTDPGKYKRFRRQNDKFAPGVHAIWGITEDGKTELQSIRFSADKFTPEEAKKWLEEHKFKTNVEAASGGKAESLDDVLTAEWNEEQKRWEVSGRVFRFPAKAGRVLSRSNEGLIKRAKEHVDDVAGADGIARGHGAQLREASSHLKTVLDSLRTPEDDLGGDEKPTDKPEKPATGTAAAMAHVLANAGRGDRAALAAQLKALADAEEAADRADEYRRTVGKAKPEDEEPEGPEPYPGQGELNVEHHKGCRMWEPKAVAAYLTKECGMKAEADEDGTTVGEMGGQAAAAVLVRKGWRHKWFAEEDDKAAGRKRCDAFEAKGLKATTVHVVGQKGVRAWISGK